MNLSVPFFAFATILAAVVIVEFLRINPFDTFPVQEARQHRIGAMCVLSWVCMTLSSIFSFLGL